MTWVANKRRYVQRIGIAMNAENLENLWSWADLGYVEAYPPPLRRQSCGGFEFDDTVGTSLLSRIPSASCAQFQDGHSVGGGVMGPPGVLEN